MPHDLRSGRWPRAIGSRSVLSYMGQPPARPVSRPAIGSARRFGAIHPGHIRLALVTCCALLWAALVWTMLSAAVGGW